MMQCNACGTLLPPAAGSCHKCGALTYTSSDYDAIPYIETKEYQEQAVLPAQSIVASTIEQPLLPPDPEKYPEQKRSSSIPGWMIALIILLSLLLIGEGIGSAIYTVNYRSANLHAQATKVAQNFLGAQVAGTAQSSAHATATANAMTPEQVYQQATSGTPLINDPLKDDSGNVWYHYVTTPPNNCSFRGGAYHVQESISGSYMCIGYGTNFNNLAFQAQIKIIKGLIGGLVFRMAGTSAVDNNYYLCLIGTNGYYALDTVNSQQAKMLANEASTAINTGQNQSNLVTIIARDNHISLYINGQFVKIITDATYTSGQIAFIASDNKGPSDVAFSNVKVWNL
jgi:hypothetical protein